MGKKTLQRLLFIFCLLLAISPARANNIFAIDDSFVKQENIITWLSSWQGEEFELAQLVERNAYFSYWKTVENTAQVASWKTVNFKLTLENTSLDKKTLILVLTEPLIDTFAVLQVDSKGRVIREDIAGNGWAYSQRAVKNRHLIYPVELDAGQTVQLFIQANGRMDRLNHTLSLWDRAAYFEKTDLDLIAKSVYSTLLLLFTVYAAFLIIVVRDHGYLWFSLFTFALFVRVMTNYNFFFELLWPDYPQLQNQILICALLTTSLSLSLFVKAFLALEESKPRLSKVYNVYAGMHIIFLLFFALTDWQLQYLIFWLVPAWSFSALMLHNSYVAYKEGMGDALAFFIAYLLITLLSLLSIISHIISVDLSWIVDGEVGELLLIITIAILLSLRIGEKQAQAQMRLAQSQAKNEFLAKMSHEIRTPINGVLGMTQLLQDSELNRKQQHYADVIDHCGKTLLNIINDILEYSKIEAGKLELEDGAFCLDELLQKHNEIFWPQIQEKGLSYSCQLPVNSNLHFFGDASRIQQVLNNLFSNAVKFTEQGKIALHVSVLQENDENALIEFIIKDTGIGMSDDEQKRVFAPFVQADNTVSRRFGGSGLGLNITRELIKLMRGELHLDSRLGEGSSFRVRLPVQVDQASRTAWLKLLQGFEGKHIVQLSSQSSEDDELFQLLQHWGVKPYYFHDHAEGLSFLEHTDESIDLVLMSKKQAIDMPALDKPIWAEQADGLLIYSESFANSETRVFGFNKTAFLKHPYSYRLLQNKLAFLLKTQSVEEISSGKLDSVLLVNSKSLRILVAEDDATNRLVMRAILKKLQLEHEIVADGQLAVDAYIADPDGFDLIIMDYEMPVLDGCQATETIRQYEKDKQLAPICIVALTAHVLEEFRLRCIESGMNDVLAKPIIINELVAILNQLASKEADS